MAVKTFEILFHDTLKDICCAGRKPPDETPQEEAQTDLDLTAITEARANAKAA